MKFVRSAAMAAVLTMAAVPTSAETFPFSAASPAEASFRASVPTIGDIPLGMAHSDVEAMFLDMRDRLSVSSADEQLGIQSAAQGTVEFTYPAELSAVPFFEESAPLQESRKVGFSSPLTGGRAVLVERGFKAADGADPLSIPDAVASLTEALGTPTKAREGRLFVWYWIDGVLVEPSAVEELHIGGMGDMSAMFSTQRMSDIENRTVACGQLLLFGENSWLSDLMLAERQGRPIAEGCTAYATARFEFHAQDDLAGAVKVRVGWGEAMAEDAKAISAHMKEALASGRGKAEGVAVGKF